MNTELIFTSNTEGQTWSEWNIFTETEKNRQAGPKANLPFRQLGVSRTVFYLQFLEQKTLFMKK